jgi:hypothetical protein
MILRVFGTTLRVVPGLPGRFAGEPLEPLSVSSKGRPRWVMFAVFGGISLPLAGNRWWNPRAKGGTAMRRWITALIVVGMGGAGVVAASPAAFAANPACLVVDTNSNQSFPGVQAAVDAAVADDTLFVKGSCTSRFTVIDKSLTVTGQSNGGIKTGTLDAGGSGAVLFIRNAVTVTFNTLVIRGGNDGGINNINGTVILNGSSVTGNTVEGSGGGGGIISGGTVILNDSTVTGNTATFGALGGGIENVLGTVTLNGNSSVTGNGNIATGAGGGIYNAGGTVTLNDSSSVTGNTASFGGGIWTDQGTVTLNDHSTVAKNTALATGGGGIFNDGTVTLNDNSTVTGNTANNNEGGGIYTRFGTLNGAVPGIGGNVFGNIPDDLFNCGC